MAETARERKATTRPDSRRGMTRSEIRAERRQRSQRRRARRRRLVIAGGLAIASVLIAALLVGPGLTPNTQQDETRLPFNEGGPVAVDQDDGREEVAVGDPHAPYALVPATSGTHWSAPPQAGENSPIPHGSPARWGEYDTFIPDEVLIQNLENGGIGIHYDCPEGCADEVQALRDIIPVDPSQFIMSPYPGMPSKFTITAWRHHLNLEEVDVDAILEFIDAYRNRAPESVPGNVY